MDNSSQGVMMISDGSVGEEKMAAHHVSRLTGHPSTEPFFFLSPPGLRRQNQNQGRDQGDYEPPFK
jgi:hypothetical protein